MKKINFIFIVLFSIMLFSCERDKVEDNNETNTKVSKKMESLTNSAIGSKENGKFKQTVSEDEILRVAKELIDKAQLDLEPLSAKIVDIDNNKYLRIYSKNDYVSTIALIYNSSTNTFWTGETVCTSKQCASGGGCVPNGQYCTECKTGVNGSMNGDCSRTTTGATSNTGFNP